MIGFESLSWKIVVILIGFKSLSWKIVVMWSVLKAYPEDVYSTDESFNTSMSENVTSKLSMKAERSRSKGCLTTRKVVALRRNLSLSTGSFFWFPR